MTTTPATITKPSSAPTDPRFDRVPMERIAMILVIPGAPGKRADRISVVETAMGGRVVVEVGGIEREVTLNVRELRALATMFSKVALRVSKRPGWKP
jgi:hypothetical protein